MEIKKQKTGFTLIELLVVIAIIGLLASIVLLALNSARAKSRDAKRLGDIRQIATALELFYNDNQNYPTTGATIGSLVPTYMGTIPYQPQSPGDGTCPAINNNTTGYTYTGNASGSTYTVTFCLGNQTGGYAAGTRTLVPGGIQ